VFQPELLVRAARLGDVGVLDGSKSAKEAWDRVAKAAGVTPEALLDSVATYLGGGRARQASWLCPPSGAAGADVSWARVAIE